MIDFSKIEKKFDLTFDKYPMEFLIFLKRKCSEYEYLFRKDKDTDKDYEYKISPKSILWFKRKG